jgi:hypothetical protein
MRVGHDAAQWRVGQFTNHFVVADAHHRHFFGYVQPGQTTRLDHLPSAGVAASHHTHRLRQRPQPGSQCVDVDIAIHFLCPRIGCVPVRIPQRAVESRFDRTLAKKLGKRLAPLPREHQSGIAAVGQVAITSLQEMLGRKRRGRRRIGVEQCAAGRIVTTHQIDRRQPQRRHQMRILRFVEPANHAVESRSLVVPPGHEFGQRLGRTWLPVVKLPFAVRPHVGGDAPQATPAVGQPRIDCQQHVSRRNGQRTRRRPAVAVGRIAAARVVVRHRFHGQCLLMRPAGVA